MDDSRIIATVVIVGIALLLGLMGYGVVRRLDLSPEQRQRTRNVLGYGLVALVLVALLIVWVELVSDAALLASGFAVAIVLFHKDLILNVLGWWQKTMSGAFRIGDRIQIGSFRGDVIDYGLLSTTLIEIYPDAAHGLRTGNILTLPNMMFLSQPVLNETRALSFEWSEISFTVDREERDAAETALFGAASTVLATYRSEMVAELEHMAENFAFHPLPPDPKIYVEAGDDDRVTLALRLAMPARAIRRTRDAVTRAFLDARSASTKP